MSAPQKTSDPQIAINSAVTLLESTVNSTLVNPRHVKKAFLRVHSYLLNLIAIGVLHALKEREGDGRVSGAIYELKHWDDIE